MNKPKPIHVMTIGVLLSLSASLYGARLIGYTILAITTAIYLLMLPTE